LEKLYDFANVFVFKELIENFVFDKTNGYNTIFCLD